MARIWKFKGPEGTLYSVEGDEPPTEEQMVEAYELALRDAYFQTETPVQAQDTERGRAVGSAISSVLTGGFGPEMSEEAYARSMAEFSAQHPEGIEPGVGPEGRAKGLALSPMGRPTVPAFLSEEAVRPAPQPQQRAAGPPLPIEHRIPPGAIIEEQRKPFTGIRQPARGGKRLVRPPTVGGLVVPSMPDLYNIQDPDPDYGYIEPGWASAIEETRARTRQRKAGQLGGLAKAIGMSMGEIGLALAEEAGSLMGGHSLMSSGMSGGEGFSPPRTSWLDLLREKGKPEKEGILRDIESRSSEGTGKLLEKDWNNIVALMDQLSKPAKPFEGEPRFGEEGKTVLANAFNKVSETVGPEHIIGDAEAFIDSPAKYAANYPLETALTAASLLLPVAPRAARAVLRHADTIASATDARWGPSSWILGDGIDFDTAFKSLNEQTVRNMSSSKRNVFQGPQEKLTVDDFLKLKETPKGIVLDRRKKSYKAIKDHAKKNDIELKTQADVDAYDPPPSGGRPARAPTGPVPDDEVLQRTRTLGALGDTRAPQTAELDEVLIHLGIKDEPYAPKSLSDKAVYAQARREALEGVDVPEMADDAMRMDYENEKITERALLLSDELQGSPRAVTPVEVAQLNTAIKHTENKIAHQIDKMAEGMDEAFPTRGEVQRHNAVVQQYKRELGALVGSTQLGASEVGRALRMFRVSIGKLFEPGRLRTRAALNKGKPLTEAESVALNKQADSVADAKIILDEKLDEIGIVQREMDNIDERIAVIKEDSPAGWKGEVKALKKDRKVWEKKRFELLQEADDAGIAMRDAAGRAEYLAEEVFIPLKNRLAGALIQSSLVLPRSLRATADLSAMLNQAIVGVASRPIAGTLSAVEMMTALLGGKRGARRTLYGPRVGGESFGLYGNTQMKLHQERVDSGLRMLDLPGASGNVIGNYEEYFARTGLEALVNYPVVGKLTKGLLATLDPFERAYGAMLNGMRARIYDDMLHHHVAAGLIPKIPGLEGWFKSPSADQKRRVATLANITTGGGAAILEGLPLGSSAMLKRVDRALKAFGQNLFWSWNQTSSAIRWMIEAVPDAIAVGAVGFPVVNPAKAGLRARKAYKAVKSRRENIQMTMEAIETTGDPKVKARLQKQLDRDMAELKSESGLDFNEATPGKVASREAMQQGIILSEYARQVGVYLFLLESMKEQGFDVDMDVFSSSFGTVTADDGYTMDLGGGRFQAMRLAVQGLTGEKRMSSGKMRDFDEDYMASYADPMLDFARSKLHPLAASAANLATGKDFIGREVGVFTELGSLAVPLFFVNALESIYDESGLYRGAKTAGLRTAYSVLGGRGYTRDEDNYAVGLIQDFLVDEFGIDETEMGAPELRDVASELLEKINPGSED